MADGGAPDIRCPPVQVDECCDPEFVHTPDNQRQLSRWVGQSGTIHYQKSGRLLFALGSPDGSPSELARACDEFDTWAASHGARSVYFGVEPPFANIISRGRRCLLIGSQAILRPGSWHEHVRRSPLLRAQISRGNRKSHIAEATGGGGRQAQSLNDCLADWLASRRARPMGFIANPRMAADIGRYQSVITATDLEGQVQAFICISAIRGGRRFIAEHIIRRPGAPNGTVEALVNHVMYSGLLPRDGALSLGLVALSQQYADDRCTNPMAFQIARRIALTFGARVYNFAGLEAFRRRLCAGRWAAVYMVADARINFFELGLSLGNLFFRPAVRR